MTETKKCSKCGAEKALMEFGIQAKGKLGLRASCKTCERARSAARHLACVQKNRDSPASDPPHPSEKKVCCLCMEDKPLEEFYQASRGGRLAQCRTCRVVLRRAWYRKNPEKGVAQVQRWQRANPEKVRASSQRRNAKKYGLSLLDRAEMLRLQSCRCAICSGLLTPGARGHAIDHDHDSGKVRGLLCIRCNAGLGCFDDEVGRFREAIAYLERHKKP